MARKEQQQLQREIDNLLRDLKRSGDDLAESQLKLQKLFQLSKDPNRGTKTKSAPGRENNIELTLSPWPSPPSDD